MLHATLGGVVFGSTGTDERMVVSVGGEQVALLEIDPRMSEVDKAGLTIETPPIAGPKTVTVAFLRRGEGPIDDLMAPIEHTLADAQIGDAYGITVLPHLRGLGILGPLRVTGLSETPSRRRIVTCRPTAAVDEAQCAKELWTSKSAELQEELRRVRTEMERHEVASEAYEAAGLRILELAQTVYSSYVTRNPREQAILVKTVVSNSTYDRGTLSPTYVKPFDVLARGSKTGDWLLGLDSNQQPSG
jgi:hypothetical protein